jgi:hypothetical protein
MRRSRHAACRKFSSEHSWRIAFVPSDLLAGVYAAEWQHEPEFLTDCWRLTIFVICELLLEGGTNPLRGTTLICPSTTTGLIIAKINLILSPDLHESINRQFEYAHTPPGSPKVWNFFLSLELASRRISYS